MTLRIGSLFSGMAGLDLAVMTVLDAEVVWNCEYDDPPARVLAHHWPDVINFHDVTKIDWKEVADTHPIDILTGGYP